MSDQPDREIDPDPAPEPGAPDETGQPGTPAPNPEPGTSDDPQPRDAPGD